MEEVKRYAKPEGFKGRGNSKNYKKDKWSCIVYDKDTGTIKEGSFATKEKLIEGMDLNITADTVYRIATGHRVDSDKKKKDSSFVSKYGHIKITKV